MRRNFFGRVLDRLMDIPRGGGVAAGLNRLLETTHKRREASGTSATTQSGSSTSLFPDEMAVVVQVDHALATADQKAGRGLRRKQKRLLTAAHTNVGLWQRLRALHTNPHWKGHPRPAQATERARAEDPSAAEKFHELFDPHWPVISARKLLLVEFVFVIVEVFFWYAVFSVDIDRRVSWLDPARISAVLLALLLPLVGVAAARLVGGLGHRWIMSYPGINKRRHAGALIAVLASALVVVAICWLVLKRFDESSVAIGSASIPAWPMAMIFGAVLVCDALARIFLMSEIREQYTGGEKEFRRLKQKAFNANQAHAAAWVALRTAVQMHWQQYQRIATVGADLVDQARARWGDANGRIGFGSTVNAHLPADDSAAVLHPQWSAMALPSSDSLYLFAQDQVLAPARCLESAMDLLRHWPPRDQRVLAAEIDALWFSLCGDKQPPLVTIEPDAPSQPEIPRTPIRHDPANSTPRLEPWEPK